MNKLIKYRASIWFLSFSSIFCLLGYLYRIIPMHTAGAYLLIPSLLIISALWFFKRDDEELHLAMMVGFWGGVIGILGYDLVRLPLHFLGLNPLTPIRSYGVFILDATHSSFTSDMAGFWYHFSNGITFAWIYSLIALRKNRWWAVAWGIVLELLAYGTVFGEVYALRSNMTAFSIGLGAHLFYGYPLGWLAEKPKERLRWLLSWSKKTGIIGILGGMSILLLFFSFAWEPVFSGHDQNGVVQLGPDAQYFGWTQVDMNQNLLVTNETGKTLLFDIPGLRDKSKIDSNEEVQIAFPNPGIYQVRTFDTGWRSSFVAVEQKGYLR